MELRHLRYLVAIADAGTFVRAAEQLRVAQPALTRQIHDLEKELGVELFDAKARKATLTTAGEACVRLARHVIRDTEQAVARARLSNSGVMGRCILASGPVPLLSGIVPRFVARMRANFPGIALVVQECSGPAQWDALVRAEADIGLGVTPFGSYPGLMVETQYVHSVDRAIVATGHPLASRKEVSLEDLRDFPFLGLEYMSSDHDAIREVMSQEMTRRKFPASSIKPREFPSYESLIAHVRAGEGWTLMPSLLEQRIGGVECLRITDFRGPFRTVRIWRGGDTRPVTQTVLRELRNAQEEVGSDVVAAKRKSVETASTAEHVPVRLDLRHLRSFVAVEKYGSLGRAAEAMDITQPALSRQMRELEYDVGVPLLDRQSRGMDLTAAGETFVQDVKSVLSIVDHVPRELRRAVRGNAQRCVIGTVPHPFADRIIVRVMADLENRGPRVRVGVRAITTPEQGEALRAGEIDIGISHAFPVPAPVPMTHGLIVTTLFDDRVSTALLATNHSLAGAASLTLRDLGHLPFLWPGRDFFPPLYDAVFAQFSAAGIKPRVDAEYEGLATMWALVAQGLGWTLGWQSHREEPPPGLCAIPLQDFSMKWGGKMAYRQDESRASVLATIDAILAHARQLHPVVNASDATLPPANTPEAVIS